MMFLNALLILADNFFVRLMSLVAPKTCAVCGCKLGVGENVICSVCASQLPRTNLYLNPADNIMARLFWGRLPVERAAALFYYEPQSEISRIIYSMKYRQHPENAEYIGRMVAKEFGSGGFFNGIDAIVPVPLARKRQRSRGYNQSFEIAKGIKGITGIVVINDAIVRKTFTESQTHKSRWQRIENVEDAFELRKPELLRGKHILIVDDVITTGSTITACGREAVRAKNVRISVLTLGFTRY